MMQFVKSLDGKTVIGGISLKDHSGEPNWYAVVERKPEPAEGDVAIVVGYERDGDGFAPIYKYVEQPKGEPMKYSTLSIKRELAELGKWDAAKTLLEDTGYWDDYILANYMSETDEVFKAACAAFVARGIVTQAELDALLPKCVWTAE